MSCSQNKSCFVYFSLSVSLTACGFSSVSVFLCRFYAFTNELLLMCSLLSYSVAIMLTLDDNRIIYGHRFSFLLYFFFCLLLGFSSILFIRFQSTCWMFECCLIRENGWHSIELEWFLCWHFIGLFTWDSHSTFFYRLFIVLFLECIESCLQSIIELKIAFQISSLSHLFLHQSISNCSESFYCIVNNSLINKWKERMLQIVDSKQENLISKKIFIVVEYVLIAFDYLIFQCDG